jgi:hypothetical protein
MKHLIWISIVLILSAPVFAQPTTSTRTPPDLPVAYTVFLIGDVGAPSLTIQEPTLALLQKQLEASDTASAVIYLGDNIYQKGLPDSAERHRKESEQYLLEQLKVTDNFPGRVFFIPGNHDWARSGRKGWERMHNQENFVEAYLKRGNVFLPDNGCPGPVEIPLGENLVLIVLDTQWFIHPWDKPGEDSDCEAKTADQVLIQLDDIVKRNMHKQILVTSHHPMYTYGSHGGYYTAKQHLFPLTDLHKDLYIPLPVLGSVYPLYRTLFGDPQDTPHPRYRLMRKALINVFGQHPSLVHAAGHEHTLQHIVRDSLNFIVSGAGCKQSHVADGKYARFTDIGEGFGKLKYFTNGEVWLEFWKPEKEGPEGTRVYAQKLNLGKLKNPVSAMEAWKNINLADSTVVVKASSQYEAGTLGKTLLGENYRKVWKQPIEVPVFDIGNEKGGLTILQRGGGMQTRSLRLENAAGQQYTLRSVEKYAIGAVPEALQNTFAVDLVQDQISASHPYAFMVIPTLAEAANIYHTNPRLVYIPDDPRLGRQQPAFANTLALFEERPAGEGEDITIEGLENAKKLYSTAKVLEKLQEDNDNQINQLAVLRARLFDLVIGDWDRHDDQWRWAGFEKGKNMVFKPIPRDRDQAFFVNEGFLPRLASRKWIMPKIQGFGYKVRDVNTFMHNARYFDRSFLTKPTLDQWIAMADSLQNELTDEVIAKALENWPAEIYKLSASEVAAKLQSRRDHLRQDAAAYYLFLARAVDITGSDKREYFEVIRLNDTQTQVRIYKLDKHGKRGETVYQRLFQKGETREIRLYGLGGEDVFHISGKVKNGILVRVIGGKDNDQITDVSQVASLFKKTRIYDTWKGNQLELSSESRNLTSDDPDINEYNRRAFQYNYLGPLASVEFNLDDGIFWGAGILYRSHAFRKAPYAMQHSLMFNYAPLTSSYHLRYRAVVTDVLGEMDLDVDFDRKKPNYVNNFFGLGNETTYTLPEEGINYYRVRFKQTMLKTLLRSPIGTFGALYLGPTYQSVDVERTPGRFISDFSLNNLTANSLEKKHYAGVNIGILIDKRDNTQLPTEGILLNADASLHKGMKPTATDFGQIYSSLALYFTFRVPAQITMATRVGAGRSFGEYEFFQAQVLSGNTNLRGFRKTRFAGESSFFHNFELRMKLFSFRSYLFPAQVGLIGFNDVGRVWLDGESSSRWHHGYGGGLYIAPLSKIVVSAMVGFSREEVLPLVKAGFLF